VLAAMTGVMAFAAGGVQVLRAEDAHIEIGALITPFVLLTLPAVFMTSAIAVLFETIPALSGGAGNIVYFFLWVALLAGGGSIGSLDRPTRDWLGRGAVMPGMIEARQAAAPGYDPDTSSVSMGITFREGGWDVPTFRWGGVRWSADAVAARFIWVIVALGIAVAAALPFDRFDPSGRVRRERAPPRPGRSWITWGRSKDAEPRPLAPVMSASQLPPAVHAAGAGPRVFATFLSAELRLTLRDQGRWWFVVLAGLTVAGLALPIDLARGRVLPLLWIWPILVWSSMGTRETRHGTDQVLFSSPHPIGGQLAATWASGFLLALATGAAIGLRLAIAGDIAGLGAWAVGAAFIPALALALGIWTGTPRSFEALFIVWWYTGPLQPIPVLDFMGASREAVAAGMPIVYAAGTLALCIAAVLGRRARLHA
jgi:hypothetical protein